MDNPSKQHPVSNVLPHPATLHMPWEPRAPQIEADEPTVNLKTHFNTLYNSRWLIGAITAFVTMLAILYGLIAKPVFEANLMIHVEEESPNASKNILSEASSLFETKKAAIAEMELLRSRMVVSRAVDNLQLYVEVQPSYFPLAGSWLTDRNGGALSRPGMFGWGGYVWGAEKMDVAVFNTPASMQNRTFTITALTGQRYRFGGGHGAPTFDAALGQRYLVPTKDGDMELKVDKMFAAPGAQFLLRRMSRLGTIERIQNALVISEQGKLSGVIEVKLQGDNAKRINQLLSEIGREYMRQNLARKTEEAEK